MMIQYTEVIRVIRPLNLELKTLPHLVNKAGNMCGTKKRLDFQNNSSPIKTLKTDERRRWKNVTFLVPVVRFSINIYVVLQMNSKVI